MKGIVSIIIPTYNRGELIKETLDSIKRQTYNNWECIVVDDGSTDNTPMILKEYILRDNRFRYYKRPKNNKKGANSCRNYGFELSKGDYINWFDDDDIMHKDFLNLKVEKLENDVNLNCVISKTSFFDGCITNIVGRENRTYSSENLLEDFITLNRSWYTWDPMWRKEFLKGKDLFSEKLLKGQDRDFHIKVLLIKNLKIAFIDEYLCYYRQHVNTISNDFSKTVALSIHEHAKERFLKLKADSVSNNTLLFLIKQIIKNYKYIKCNEIDFYNFLLKNRINNVLFYKWFFKFTLCVISFKILNKGEFFLKG